MINPHPLTIEEKRALEVAQCARSAVMDLATMCARAGLIGEAITSELENAHNAIVRIIDCIKEPT